MELRCAYESKEAKNNVAVSCFDNNDLEAESLGSIGNERRDIKADGMMWATNLSSQFPEEEDDFRPPLFSGSNYGYWRMLMKRYINVELWEVMQSPPTTPSSQWTDLEKTKNAQAMHVLFCALADNEFSLVYTAKTAHQIWHILEKIHAKREIYLLVQRFESFKMMKNETITEMYTRLTDITCSLSELGKIYTQTEIVQKTLHALTLKWEAMVIEEANDLSKLTMEELRWKLMAYEIHLERRQKEAQKKKALEFKATPEMDGSDYYNGVSVSIIRQFRKFLKQFKKLTMEELRWKLMANEIHVERRQKESQKKKALEFKATSEMDDSADYNEEIVILIRQFKKFLKKFKKFTMEELRWKLMANEIHLERRQKEAQKKKALEFKATSEMDDSADYNEEIVCMIRQFKKFLKQFKKFIMEELRRKIMAYEIHLLKQGKFKSNMFRNTPLCWKCNKSGHIKKDCPLLKTKAINFDKPKKFKEEEASEGTWDDSD